MIDNVLNSIVLIDDSESENAYNKRVIERAYTSCDVFTFTKAQEALQWLATADESGKFPAPDIILLDASMPEMDGWEFLAAYNELEGAQESETQIVLLTNYLKPIEWQRAKREKNVSGIHIKPLTAELLGEMLFKQS